MIQDRCGGMDARVAWSIININSLTAVLIINRCPSPVRGHHPILVLYARFIPLCQYPDIISHTFE